VCGVCNRLHTKKWAYPDSVRLPYYLVEGFWSLSGQGQSKYGRGESIKVKLSLSTTRMGHSSMSLAERGHTLGNRIEWWNRDRTIVAATGTFNPLVAGSNPARPTTNAQYQMKELREI
jgi:hypothetical protein